MRGKLAGLGLLLALQITLVRPAQLSLGTGSAEPGGSFQMEVGYSAPQVET
jgi:hypothetical protein